MFCLKNIWADRKEYRLEISGPGLRFVGIYMKPVRTQTGTRLSRLGLATDTKPDLSELIIRPVSWKRIKRNVWRPMRTYAGLSSSRSHVNTPLPPPPLTREYSLTRPNKYNVQCVQRKDPSIDGTPSFNITPYYMALSHEDWELQNSRI